MRTIVKRIREDIYVCKPVLSWKEANFSAVLIISTELLIFLILIYLILVKNTFFEFLLDIACRVGHHGEADPFVISMGKMMFKDLQPTGCHTASQCNPHLATSAGGLVLWSSSTTAKLLQQRMQQMNVG